MPLNGTSSDTAANGTSTAPLGFGAGPNNGTNSSLVLQGGSLAGVNQVVLQMVSER